MDIFQGSNHKMMPTMHLRSYPKGLRRFLKHRNQAPGFLPIVRFYTTNQIEEGEEGRFRKINDAHQKFIELTAPIQSRPGRVLIARFCNSAEELTAPLKRFYGNFDYSADMVNYLHSPEHIAQSVVMHLDGAGQSIKLDKDVPTYVRLCSRNSPYISTTRSIYSTRRVVEFEQKHGDLLFDIVNNAKKLYILEVPRTLVIDVTLRGAHLSYYEILDIISTKKTLEDFQQLMSILFYAPISDPLFVTKLWDFYHGDMNRIVDYYLYLSRINESLCLSVGKMEKYIYKECDNPFKGDLRTLDSRATAYRFE